MQTQYTFDPFGATTASGPSSSNALQFTGRENDGTGLTGGVATVENIQLRCRAHNLYEALLFFGEGSECIRECGAEWSTRDVSSFRNESERAGLMGTSWRALKR
jgi:hypothetical protein